MVHKVGNRQTLVSISIMEKEGTLKGGGKVKGGRKLTHEQNEYIRKQAVKGWLFAGRARATRI